MKNQSAKNLEPEQREIIHDLEQIKRPAEEHAEFYENFEQKQKEIIADLEAMRNLKENTEKL